jgi:hypothetical protein
MRTKLVFIQFWNHKVCKKSLSSSLHQKPLGADACTRHGWHHWVQTLARDMDGTIGCKRLHETWMGRDMDGTIGCKRLHETWMAARLCGWCTLAQHQVRPTVRFLRFSKRFLTKTLHETLHETLPLSQDACLFPPLPLPPPSCLTLRHHFDNFTFPLPPRQRYSKS